MPFSHHALAAVTLFLAGLAVPGRAAAQRPGSTPPRQAVFSSTYTDLARDCRSAFTPRQEKAARRRGQDIPLSCKGPGGQAVFVSYSAMASMLFVGPAGARDERLRLVATQDLGFTDTRGRKIEWRLANGKPFAAILRIVDYTLPASSDGEHPFDPRYASGSSLVAVGLVGFEQIQMTMQAQKPDANAEFRRRVDALYYPPGRSYAAP